MKNIQALKEERAELVARSQAIIAIATEEKREPTAEENAELDSINNEGGKIDEIDAKIARLQKIEDRQKQIVEQRFGGRIEPSPEDEDDTFCRFNIPANQRGFRPKNFTGEHAEKHAFFAGQWASAIVFGNDTARRWLDNNGFEAFNLLSTENNESAGFLIPSVLENAIISNFENYGVIDANIGMEKPIVGGTWTGPREREGVTFYYPGEGIATTESVPKYGQVKLNVNDAVAEITISRNLDQDAIPAMGDNVVRMFSRGWAKARDSAGFNGDGTSAYGGMVGIKNALQDGCDVTATGETTFGALTVGRFESMVGRLPDWEGIQPKWYISKPAYYASMARLQMAAGGNAVADFGNGPVLQYLGYPVVFTNVLPKALSSLSGERVAYFGDLEMAMAMGTARGMSIEADRSVKFRERLIVVQAFGRYDINVYEVGDNTEAGGIIALKMG